MDLSESENDKSCEIEDEEEDDFTTYFMRPVIDGYNIKEKVEAANKILFKDGINLNEENKKTVVQFRENLVEYEPEYSSDYNSVSSIEEVDEIKDEDNSQENNIVEEILNDTVETIEENEQILNEIVISEEIDLCKQMNSTEIEDIADTPSECVFFNLETKNDDRIDEDSSDSISETISAISIHDNQLENFSSEIQETDNTEQKKDINKLSFKKRSVKKDTYEIKCHDLCLENLDKDVNNISYANFMKGPVLKLHRQCCDSSNLKGKELLPLYNGYNSEYGLSKVQLDIRTKKMEIKQKKMEEKSIRRKEESQRKSEMNERIFCEWLQNKSTRNKQKLKTNKNNPYISNRAAIKLKRPVTAFQNQKTISNKIRPHTTPSAYKISLNLPHPQMGQNISLNKLIPRTKLKNNFYNQINIHFIAPS